MEPSHHTRSNETRWELERVHVGDMTLKALRNPENLCLPVEFLHVWLVVIDRHDSHGRVLRKHARLEPRPATGIEHTCMRPDAGY